MVKIARILLWGKPVSLKSLRYVQAAFMWLITYTTAKQNHRKGIRLLKT